MAPPRALTNAATPGNNAVSRNASSDQLAASLASHRIAATSGASATASNSRITKPSRAVPSLPMARRILPENLRVRSPHIIRVQRQRVRKLPHPCSLFPHLRYSRRQPIRTMNQRFSTCGPFFPTWHIRNQFRIQRDPPNPISICVLPNPLHKLIRCNHHLVFNQAPTPLAFALVKPAEHLPPLRIKTRSHKSTGARQPPRHHFESRNSHHLYPEQLRPSLHRRQPHSQSRKRTRPRSPCQQFYIPEVYPRRRQSALHRRQQPRRIILRAFMLLHGHQHPTLPDGDAPSRLARINAQRNQSALLAPCTLSPFLPIWLTASNQRS